VLSRPAPARWRLVVAVALAAGLSACGGHGGTPSAESSASLSPADQLVSTGLSQLKSGDTTAAKATFASALALDPKNVYALFDLGLIAQDAADPATAKTYYEAALASQPDYAPALYNEAIVLERTDLGKSVALYQHATRADPTMAAAYIRLGFALAHLGKTDQAAAARAKGLALDPTLASAPTPSY